MCPLKNNKHYLVFVSASCTMWSLWGWIAKATKVGLFQGFASGINATVPTKKTLPAQRKTPNRWVFSPP